MNLTTVLVFLALIIILILAAIAGIMWRKVFKHRQLEKAQHVQQMAQRQKQRAEIIESINVISRTLLAGEMNESEGVIRLKVLMDNLYLTDEIRQRFSVIEEMYEQVKDFDTHESRLRLSKEVRMKQDLARHRIEAEYRNRLFSDLHDLAVYEFPSLH